MRGRLRAADSGAVFVEYVLVLTPFLLLALSGLELLELWTAKILMKRAATAAVRAAAVVLPDEPRFYEDVPVNRFDGARKSAVELAAALVLVPTPEFRELVGVALDFSPDSSLVTATVRARFRCSLGFTSVVCPGGEQVLSGRASFPYQAAHYAYARTAS